MLDKQDLQAIKELVDTSVTTAVTASEERLKEYVDTSITASEERLKGYVDDSIAGAENRWRVLYEADIRPSFRLLAEGHENLLQTLASNERVEKLEEEVVTIKSVIKGMKKEIAELKKAQ